MLWNLVTGCRIQRVQDDLPVESALDTIHPRRDCGVAA
jgi:hypothetical protein